MPLHLHLCDRNTPMCEAWARIFADRALCTVHMDDFFSVEADIMVSGGNSLGFLHEGLELAIALKLGPQMEGRLRETLLREHGGLLPVGQAVGLATEDPRWPLFFFAPTTWVPMDIDGTIHPYLAARAAFRLWQQQPDAGVRVWHMLMPGLGTGPGRVPAQVCAQQMRRAYDEIILGRVRWDQPLEESVAEYRALCEG